MKKIKLHSERTNHDQYLNNLIFHLDYIGEDKRNIEWIMKDGIWQRDPGSKARYTLCDILIRYDSGNGVPIELKGSTYQIAKAEKQIRAGKEFLEKLNIPVNYGKMVAYTPLGYYYKKLDFKTNKWGQWKLAPFILKE